MASAGFRRLTVESFEGRIVPSRMIAPSPLSPTPWATQTAPSSPSQDSTDLRSFDGHDGFPSHDAADFRAMPPAPTGSGEGITSRTPSPAPQPGATQFGPQPSPPFDRQTMDDRRIRPPSDGGTLTGDRAISPNSGPGSIAQGSFRPAAPIGQNPPTAPTFAPFRDAAPTPPTGAAQPQPVPNVGGQFVQQVIAAHLVPPAQPPAFATRNQGPAPEVRPEVVPPPAPTEPRAAQPADGGEAVRTPDFSALAAAMAARAKGAAPYYGPTRTAWDAAPPQASLQDAPARFGMNPATAAAVAAEYARSGPDGFAETHRATWFATTPFVATDMGEPRTEPEGSEAVPSPNLPSESTPAPAAADGAKGASTWSDIADQIVFLGTPVVGSLPVDLEGVQNGTRDFLNRLADLGAELPTDGFDTDDSLWVAAAALAVGGFAYSVYLRPSRRYTLAGAPGLDSVLARWNARNDDTSR